MLRPSCPYFFPPRLLHSTYIFTKERTAPGFKAAKDRLTLALGGNAEGDVKLKPLLVYSHENPRALKNTSKPSLPVYWKSSKKAWVTTSIFHDYIYNYFSPFVSRYTSANNLANKALLLLDNAPAHTPAMVDWCANVQVCFLPPNTTSLIQPCDQGLISTFKSYYTRRAMHALSVAHRDGIIDGPQAYWKTFDIKKAVEMIGEAWQEITPVTMNAVWRKLWPQAVHNFTGFAVPDTAALSKEIAALANESALGDGKEVTEEDVQQLLNSHDQELTTQELLELEETRTDAADPESPVPPLTITQLQKALELYYEANDFLLQIDPDMDRSFKVRSSVKGAIRCYEELLRSKQMEKKQQRITAYFKPALAPQPSAAAPPSSD